jgi:hypothetical protein
MTVAWESVDPVDCSADSINTFFNSIACGDMDCLHRHSSLLRLDRQGSLQSQCCVLWQDTDRNDNARHSMQCRKTWQYDRCRG